MKLIGSPLTELIYPRIHGSATVDGYFYDIRNNPLLIDHPRGAKLINNITNVHAWIHALRK